MFFPPYDCPTADQTMIDLQMIDNVTKAAKAYKGKLDPYDPNNPFQIKYSVYNLYDESYLKGLIKSIPNWCICSSTNSIYTSTSSRI